MQQQATDYCLRTTDDSRIHVHSAREQLNWVADVQSFPDDESLRMLTHDHRAVKSLASIDAPDKRFGAEIRLGLLAVRVVKLRTITTHRAMLRFREFAYVNNERQIGRAHV